MAQWPTSVATDANLYIAVNELQTNLAVGIGTSDTTLNLNSTTSFPTVGLILIDNEIIQYTGIAGNNLTGCTRAFDGTTAASHSTAAIVSFAIPAAHHNVLKDEIKAIETYLSNNLGLNSQPLATGNRVLLSNAGGKIVESSVTNTSLGFLDATSSIQTQLNALAPSASPTFTGTITTPLTASRAVATGAAGVLAASATTATELGFVSGVTSAIQTQLNAKQATLTAGQLPGTATNDSATAGNVGEYVSSTVNAFNFPATGTAGDATTISLTAGDWDISIGGHIEGGTSTDSIWWIGTTAGNSFAEQAAPYDNECRLIAGTTRSGTAGPIRKSLSGTTTIRLKIYAAFSVQPQFWGTIRARRVR